MKDFFISYNKHDKKWAEWIAGVLEENGYSTVIQSWDFQPGNNFVVEMQNAIKNCDKMIIVLSENYLESEYCQSEWTAVFATDPTGKQRRIIPIRISEVSTSGLLLPKVFIDLYEADEEEATNRVLEGVNNKDNPRKKPQFPGATKKPVFPNQKTQIKEYSFIFSINDDNKAEKLSIESKNSLREWYKNNCPLSFIVKIIDKRIERIHENLHDINEKIENGEELSISEEIKHYNYSKAIEKCEYENRIKISAITFFLKDTYLQSYFNYSSYLEVYELVKTIIEFDYYNDINKKLNDRTYTSLDFYISPPPKECCDHFVVPIKTTLIDEIFNGHTVYHIMGDAVDLGSEVLKQIAVYFYIFLGEEIQKVDYYILKKHKMLSIFNYHIGLH